MCKRNKEKTNQPIINDPLGECLKSGAEEELKGLLDWMKKSKDDQIRCYHATARTLLARAALTTPLLESTAKILVSFAADQVDFDVFSAGYLALCQHGARGDFDESLRLSGNVDLDGTIQAKIKTLSKSAFDAWMYYMAMTDDIEGWSRKFISYLIRTIFEKHFIETSTLLFLLAAAFELPDLLDVTELHVHFCGGCAGKEPNGEKLGDSADGERSDGAKGSATFAERRRTCDGVGECGRKCCGRCGDRDLN